MSKNNRRSIARDAQPPSNGCLQRARLQPNDLRPLYRLKPFRTLFDLFMDWAIILGITALSLSIQSIPLYIIAVIIIGGRMHALLVLMHDASHFRFLPNRNLGDSLMNMLVCWPMFVDVRNYRRNHQAHHQHLNSEEDPDWVAKLGMKEYTHPQSKMALVFRIMLYMIGYHGVQDFIWILKRFRQRGNVQPDMFKLAYYTGILALITIAGLWAVVILYWVVPFFTVLMCLIYLRSTSEHYAGLEGHSELDSTRTLIANPIEQFLIIPHNIGYHLEHHLYPGVPYYNLPILHRKLMELSEYRENAHITRGFFTGFINELTSIAKPQPGRS